MKNAFGLPRSEESIRAQPDFKFYPKSVQESFFNFYKKAKLFSEVPVEKRARWIQIREKIIKAIFEAGGKIMTGSIRPNFCFFTGFRCTAR